MYFPILVRMFNCKHNTIDNWKICCQCQTCSTFFAYAAIQVMYQLASVTNQCLTRSRLSIKLSLSDVHLHEIVLNILNKMDIDVPISTETRYEILINHSEQHNKAKG